VAELAAAPEVVVLDRGPRPELASPALHRLLVARAVAWASGVFGVGASGGSGVFRASGASGADVRVRDASLADLTVGDRPLLALVPELPAWRPDLADAVLDDLRSGCDISLGPVYDGGFYLVGLTRPLPAAAWGGHDAMGLALTAANDAGLEVGLLRTERGLRTPADARALLADPLTDSELRALLE
jgi:glycosyltransferase A (GT-A) superfamily protein (DUF2064 family)